MVVLAFLIALSVERFSLAMDWPQFRGPSGDGVSQASNVPLHWSATDQVVWKQEVPGTGWSSPVLSQNKLYLTTAVDTSGAVSLRALCLNASDGHVHWNVEAFQPESSSAKAMHSKNSLASPTPLIHRDRLYIHFGHMGTAALDLDGNIVWKQSALKYQPRHGNGGSPMLIDDILVFSCDSEQVPFLAGLGTTNGDVRWKTNRETTALKKFSFSTPIVIEVDGATQIVSPGSGFVGAYDPKDGKEIWRVNYGEGYSVVPRPVFAHGLVFVASGFEKPILLAIDPRGARGDVTATHIKWQHEKGAPLTPSPLVAGDELYFVSDAGVASCLDARTGKVHWTKRLGGNFSASPVCADGRVYFQSEDGVTYVIETGTEFNSLATNDIEERTLASPAVSTGTLFLRSESHLWRIGQPDRFSQQGRRQIQIDRN
jgi:outer membrane protein assembly factor BamB